MIRTNTTQLKDLEIIDLQIRTDVEKVNSCDVKNLADTFFYNATLMLPNKNALNCDELRTDGYIDMEDHRVLDELRQKCNFYFFKNKLFNCNFS